jgi:hypothetical protein
MELKDLVGPHKLTGVDRYNEDVKYSYGDGYENCEHISFRLDGKVYTAIEDPSDGYRSNMRDIQVSDHKMSNTFKAVNVIARYVDHRAPNKYSAEECDILELINAKNGEVILSVGTGNTNDYYPYWVAEFNPPAIGLVSE